MMAAKMSGRRTREEQDASYERDSRRARSTREDPKDKARRHRSKVPLEPVRAPYMSGGNGKDKISSWVYSQADEPPEPPPIMPTVIDVPPPAEGTGNAHSLSSDEEARRSARRKARRRAQAEEEEDARSRRRGSRREGVKSSSGSGDYERDRDRARSQPGNRQGAPPPSAKKSSSWFRKLTNL